MEISLARQQQGEDHRNIGTRGAQEPENQQGQALRTLV
eukprot:COSAG06_NODE_51326_length_313_cov_0.602804_1_plen_37_part_10